MGNLVAKIRWNKLNLFVNSTKRALATFFVQFLKKQH